jgi:hypothetical protein
VILQWNANEGVADSGAMPTAAARVPRAIVLVDAASGNVIATRVDQP